MYEAGGPDVGYAQFNPRRGKELLLRHAKNLRKVVMNMVEAVQASRRGWNGDDKHLDVLLAERGVEVNLEL